MIYQIQILLRDLKVRLPWEDVGQSLLRQLPARDIIIDKSGSFQCRYYISENWDKDALEQEIRQIVDSFLPDEDDTTALFSVSAKLLSEKEIAALISGPKAQVFNRDWFIAAASPETEAPAKEREAAAETPLRKNPVTVHESDEPIVRAPAAEDAEAAPAPRTLLELADHIRKMNNHLLRKVRGQRHAVTELVQGVFESELFTKNAPERKGPLATFLFMGPSGVGKTFLAKEFGAIAGRPVLTVDMSEYSDNLANLKFNGDHGENAVVTGFVRKNPNAILIFDEIEKAHINTIHLFLQILDAGQLMDQKIHKEVSFQDTIIIMTTNAGSSLYENGEARILSNISRPAMIAALRSEKKPEQIDVPVFPESITTRMANGHVILFNYLEPYALMEIVSDEIDLQLGLFSQSTGIGIDYDKTDLSSLVMYAAGAAADARTLRGLARNILVKELQDITLQLASAPGQPLEKLKTLRITVDKENASEDIRPLFYQSRPVQALVFTDSAAAADACAAFGEEAVLYVTAEEADMHKRLRGVIDFVLLDPFTGYTAQEQTPNDIDDIRSAGMRIFEYILEYFPETPIYILDDGTHGMVDFSTLLARRARSVLTVSDSLVSFHDGLQQLTINALIGNSIYRLGRSQKYVCYNCAQYFDGNDSAEIRFTGMRLKTAVAGEDMGSVTHRGENSSITFEDIVGCKAAKETLAEYCAMLDDPQKSLLAGMRLPKGLLLYGAPGTGKTMLAKAMANESNAMFLPVSATSFFGSLVGQTEQNIRDLFRKARKYAPSVIFIDEVDAIARRRTGSVSTAHNEDALNTFLAEMDGFTVDEKRPVFILAATNYDIEGDGNRVLDPAFVRRFDRKIHIPLPDTEDREELFHRCLKRHSLNFGPDHDSIVHGMAQRSGGMCSGDIEMMVEMYVRSLKDEAPTGSGFMDTLDEFRFGEVKKHDPDDLLQTAYHEAGHTLVCWASGVKPLFLTIVSRSNYGGYMETSSEDNGTYTYDELKDIACRCLAGRAAEIVVYGEHLGLNTGASSDIRQARHLVRACLTDYGMGDTLYIQKTAEAGEALMREQFSRAQAILTANRQCLDALAHLLVAEKCLDQASLENFFAENSLTVPQNN
ncbi:MAG: AAA family ATPase [Oscillospiraceae bacterium]|nr:AAA family ATPase [Oscillospiraceae bacterium]